MKQRLKALKVFHDVTNRLVYMFISEFFRLAGFYIGEGIADEYSAEEYLRDEGCFQLFLYISEDAPQNRELLRWQHVLKHIVPASYSQKNEDKITFLNNLITDLDQMSSANGIEFPLIPLQKLVNIYVDNDLCKASYNLQYYRLESKIHHFSLDAYKKASEEFETLAVQEDAEPYLKYADLYCKQKMNLACSYLPEAAFVNPTESLAQMCKTFIEEYPFFSNARVLLGMIYELSHDNLKNAIFAYQDALSMEDDKCYSAHIYYWIGKLYENWDRYDLARDSYEKAYYYKKKYRNIYKMSAMANHDKDYVKRYLYLKECIDMLEPRRQLFMDPLEIEYYFKICGLLCFNCAVQRQTNYDEVILYGSKAIDFYYHYVYDAPSFQELYGKDAKTYRDLSRGRWNLKNTYQCMAIAYRETGDLVESERYWKLSEG